MTKAEVSFNRADQLYHNSVRVFFAFAFIMLIVIIVQVATLQGDFAKAQTAELKRQEVAREEAREESRKRLDRALAETEAQELVTQNYIRCVAVISLLPIEQRTAKMLDDCGIPGVTDPSELGNPNPNQAPRATQSSPQSVQPAPNEPVAAGAPPDDETPARTNSRSPLSRLPFVGRFFE